MKEIIPVVDLFAGPGGLGEGFHSFENDDGINPFEVVLSVEKDTHAHETLFLRSLMRQFGAGEIPELYYKVLRGEESHRRFEGDYSTKWDRTAIIALHAELGNPKDEKRIDKAYERVYREADGRPIILLGGPPCQAYSLVGRARNKGIGSYKAEDDPRHLLYREYLKAISYLWPAVFVMENVKGILSSRLNGDSIFQRILEDLSDPGTALRYHSKNQPSPYTYSVVSIAAATDTEDIFENRKPRDFIVRSESHGIPQRRHRVILLGIRNDIQTSGPIRLAIANKKISAKAVIEDIPAVRSGLSREVDSKSAWLTAIKNVENREWYKSLAKSNHLELVDAIREIVCTIKSPAIGRGAEFISGDPNIDNKSLSSWYIDNRLRGFCNHSTRAHMNTDLERYLFVATFGNIYKKSPKLSDFPVGLLPNHANAKDAAKSNSLFTDRFRVQLTEEPSATITSHIAKDGHYYIHYDPRQCRSLTVREAARLQTFPDNYLFAGPRTSQYTQVGNAVPPLLALQIAEKVYQVLTGISEHK